MDVSDLKGLFGEVKKRMDTQIDHVRRELGGVHGGDSRTRRGQTALRFLPGDAGPAHHDRCTHAASALHQQFAGAFGRNAGSLCDDAPGAIGVSESRSMKPLLT